MIQTYMEKVRHHLLTNYRINYPTLMYYSIATTLTYGRSPLNA